MESRAEFQKLKSLCPGIELREQEPLRVHTSFQIGGPAALMAFPKTPGELQRLLMAARECGVRLRVLGAGTNVLAPDAGLPELVICTRGCLLGLRLLDGGRLEAMAGETLSRAAVFAREHALTGLEFAHGIPGTVGGGVYMNAGAYGGELAQIAVETTVLLTDGTQRVLRGEAQAFGYRTSAFEKLDCVIVKTVFELHPGDPEQIQARMRELMEKRRASQPLELPSAGSTFKRPQGAYAGALIERAGLKGKGVGGAQVSEKHAGFVVNTGGATASDVLQTIRMVQDRVFEDSGFRLEPEVRIW